MPEPKRAYVFQDTQPMAVEARAANALEFIAYYLDRIDGHLERLAANVESGQANGARIGLELASITHLLGRMASGRTQG